MLLTYLYHSLITRGASLKTAAKRKQTARNSTFREARSSHTIEKLLLPHSHQGYPQQSNPTERTSEMIHEAPANAAGPEATTGKINRHTQQSAHFRLQAATRYSSSTYHSVTAGNLVTDKIPCVLSILSPPSRSNDAADADARAGDTRRDVFIFQLTFPSAAPIQSSVLLRPPPVKWRRAQVVQKVQ